MAGISEDILEFALKRFPESSKLLSCQSLLYFFRGNEERAKELRERAFQINKNEAFQMLSFSVPEKSVSFQEKKKNLFMKIVSYYTAGLLQYLLRPLYGKVKKVKDKIQSYIKL